MKFTKNSFSLKINLILLLKEYILKKLFFSFFYSSYIFKEIIISCSKEKNYIYILYLKFKNMSSIVII